MRLVEATGQHFGYRVMLGRVVAHPPGSLLGSFGITFQLSSGEVLRQKVEEWADQIRVRLGGDAYSMREAKLLQQSWCYDKTKVLGDDVNYFAFVNDEDAMWFMLIANRES
jgi:hypothetical protein